MIFSAISDRSKQWAVPVEAAESDAADIDVAGEASDASPSWFSGVMDAVYGGFRSATLETQSAAQGVVSGLGVGDEDYRLRLDALARENREKASLLATRADQSSSAASIVHGVVNGFTKVGMAIPGLMIPGVGGTVATAALFGGQLGVNRTQTLKDQGVDEKTATKAGLVTGATNALFAVAPAAVGGRIVTRALTGGALGAASSASEMAGVRAILEDADYSKAAEQFDPTNPVDLAINAAVGGLLGAVSRPVRRYRTKDGRDVTVEVEDAARTRAQDIAAAANLPVNQADGAAVQRARSEQERVARAFNEGRAVQADPATVDAKRIEELHAASMEHMAQQAADGQINWQNRARTSKESIAQMNAIASAPYYLRVAPGRILSEGAPVIAYGESIPEVQYGNPVTIVDGQGDRYKARYAVVDADSVVTSNLADGTPNSLYNIESRESPKAVAGNGRVAGLAEGYRRGTMDQYKSDFIEDAATSGIDPTVIQSMERPILVRVVNADDLPADIGIRSNQRQTSAFTQTEQAITDAQSIDLSRLRFDDDGDIGTDAVMEFVSQLPASERNGLVVNGRIQPAAQKRLETAIFQATYENAGLTEALDSEGIRTLKKAALRLAPRLIGLKNAGPDLDFRSSVADLLNEVNANRGKLKLSELAKQQTMERTPETQAFLDFLALNEERKGGYKPIVEAFSDMADFVKANQEAALQGQGMFDDIAAPTVTKLDLMREFSRVTGVPINEADFRPTDTLSDIARAQRSEAIAESGQTGGDSLAASLAEHADDAKRAEIIRQSLDAIRQSTADNTLQKQAAVQALADAPDMTIQIDGEDGSISAAEYIAREEARADEMVQAAERGTSEAVVCAIINNGI